MFLTKPVLFQEASDAIAGLAPVDRDTFANLIPELKDAALTIAGVEGLEVVTRVRDLISQLPLGGDFEELKAKIEEELSPWLTEKGAAKRATLLLRLHGFRAYAAAGYRQMEAHKDAFPYRQYVATMDEATRHSHRALHGVVLPSNHPFWLNHTGPWAWGCRCEAVPLTAGAMERIQKADESRDPDKALVITGPLLQKLEAGELVRGPTMIFDVRTERERTGDPNAFEWQPGYAGMTLEEIGKRYTPLEMQHFERWASGVETGDGRNLWEVLSKGRGPSPNPAPAAAPVPGPALAPAPASGTRTRDSVEAEVRDIVQEMAGMEQELITLHTRKGLADQATPEGRADKVALEARWIEINRNLIAKKEAFRKAIEVPAGERGTLAVSALVERNLNRRPDWNAALKKWEYEMKEKASKPLLKHVAKGAEIVSRWVHADLLRPARVALNKGRAFYSPSKDAIYVTTSTDLDVVAHELVHPIEAHHAEVLAASRAFLKLRAAGQPVQTLRSLENNPGYDLKEVAFEDEWKQRGGKNYSGKLYSPTGKTEDANATELLTVGIQRLEQMAFEFHRDDPEYFWFCVSTLQKLP